MDDLNQAFRIIEIYQVLKPLEIVLCTLKKRCLTTKFHICLHWMDVQFWPLSEEI